MEGASTEGDLNEILPNLIGTSEFIYAIPEDGKSKTARMYLDEVYPIINTVPGPLPILGVGAGFAFTRRLRLRIRQGGRVTPQGSSQLQRHLQVLLLQELDHLLQIVLALARHPQAVALDGHRHPVPPTVSLG